MVNLVKETDSENYSVYWENGDYAGHIYKQEPRTDGTVYYEIRLFTGIRYDGSSEHQWTRHNYKTLAAAKYAFKAVWEEYGSPKPKVKARGYSAKFLTADVNPDFYPTPSKLIGMMIGGIKHTKTIKTVLEPSAGKGDIVECLVKSKRNVKHYGYYEVFKNSDIDCIELDENLQHILKGKGYKVVYDDFLDFHTLKRYDLIIMNPPFSAGSAHLLKAIYTQRNGGQICCILNAETLLNPYTIERKELLKKLGEYNASVKYVENAFKTSERKTNVTVAVIWIDIPIKENSSKILENLEKAEEEHFEEAQGPTELALGDYMENLVSGFRKECQLCKALILEHEALKPYIMRSYDVDAYTVPIIELKVKGTSADNADEAINGCVKAIRRKYWEKFLTHEELMSKFTSNLREQFMSMRDDMENYDFNIFNIRQIIARMNVELFDGVKSCIFTLFDRLSNMHSYRDDYDNGNIHYYNGWKTNKAHYVNKKVIIPCYGAFSSWSGNFDERNAYNALADIEKSLNYLDGRATEYVDLNACIRNRASTRKIPCKYFYVTFYKKGTMHIQFREEFLYLVDALNIFVGKSRNWLPPSYGEKRYSDMTQEEKDVIDSFQGKDEYEKVMSEPSLYLFNPSENKMLALMG